MFIAPLLLFIPLTMTQRIEIRRGYANEAFILSRDDGLLGISNRNIMNEQNDRGQQVIVSIPYLDSGEFEFVRESVPDIDGARAGQFHMGFSSDFRRSLSSLMIAHSRVEGSMVLIPNHLNPAELAVDRELNYLSAIHGDATELIDPFSQFVGNIELGNSLARRDIDIHFDLERFGDLVVPREIYNRLVNLIVALGGTMENSSRNVRRCSQELLHGLPSISITLKRSMADERALNIVLFPEDYITQSGPTSCRLNVFVEPYVSPRIVLTLKQLTNFVIHWDFENNRVGFGEAP